MNFTIGDRIAADTRIQGVTVRPVVGAYELHFGLSITIHADEDNGRRAVILGGRVGVRTGGSAVHDMGFARPEAPFDIVTRRSPSVMTPALVLPLQPGQLAAIENLRGTGDLDFELRVTGTGIDRNGAQQVQDTLRVPVPRSDWIKKLRDANG